MSELYPFTNPPALVSPAISHGRLSFDRAFEVILDVENGYTDHPRDPGRATNFGISQRSYPHIDVKKLTPEQAAQILFWDFWTPCRASELPAPLALVCFDSAVLDGRGTAVRLLQQAVGVTNDGIIGPLTIAAAWRSTPDAIVRFLSARDRRYHDLVRREPFRAEFLPGWINRLFRVHREAVRLEANQ